MHGGIQGDLLGDGSGEAFQDRLEALMTGGAYSTANPIAIRLSKDKIRSLLAIMGAGINAPRTAVITSARATELDLDKVLKAVEANAGTAVRAPNTAIPVAPLHLRLGAHFLSLRPGGGSRRRTRSSLGQETEE